MLRLQKQEIFIMKLSLFLKDFYSVEIRTWNHIKGILDWFCNNNKTS